MRERENADFVICLSSLAYLGGRGSRLPPPQRALENKRKKKGKEKKKKERKRKKEKRKRKRGSRKREIKKKDKKRKKDKRKKSPWLYAAGRAVFPIY